MKKYNLIVVLPPYATPGHKELLQKAYDSLKEYEKHLIGMLKKKLFYNGQKINPHPSDVQEIEKIYHEDTMRQMLLKNLSNVKLLVEKPCSMVKEI